MNNEESYEQFKLKRMVKRAKDRQELSRVFILRDNRRGIYDIGKNAAKRSKNADR